MNQQSHKTKYEPFIRNDQYNFIRNQLKTILHAIATVKDQNVIDAVKLSALDQTIALFDGSLQDRGINLNTIAEITDEAEAKLFLTEMEEYIIPFPDITENSVAKLFPKLKKLKAPDLASINFKRLSYLCWHDVRLNRKLLIVQHENKLIGIQGSFRESKKDICTICNEFEEVGLFMSIVKSGNETYTSRGNYICRDSQKCNENITSIHRLNKFTDVVKKV